MFPKKLVCSATLLLAKAINMHKAHARDGSKGGGGARRRKDPQPARPLPAGFQDDEQTALGVMTYVVQQMLAPLPARGERPEPPTSTPSSEAGLSSENTAGEDDACAGSASEGDDGMQLDQWELDFKSDPMAHLDDVWESGQHTDAQRSSVHQDDRKPDHFLEAGHNSS